MSTYVIYFVITIILLVVIVITAKAVNRGIESKQNKSKNITNDKNKFY
tara:strand:- start:3053 stop:3196 length:144 start_codon:yes stop_codon:yes gene_type:complete